jgi:hypothetical protein
VTPQEQVAKLEALLARVNGRRNAPRAPVADVTTTLVSAQSPVAAPPKKAEVTPSPAPVAVKPVAASPAAATARPAAPAPSPTPAPVAAKPAPSPAPPPVAVTAPVPASAPSGPEMEVVVEEGMAEVDLEGIDDASGGELSDSVADLDAVAGGTGEEEAPASSRRPIPMQAKLDELAEANANAPPHPAPPESRRQVAVTPEADFEADLNKSGVRPAPDVPATPPPAAPAAELKADVTKPVVAAASPAVFRGQIPTTKPASFGELLDLTLGL